MMQKSQKSKSIFLALVVLAGVMLNAFWSHMAAHFASEEQKNPPNGGQELPIFSRVVNKLVQQKQDLWTSSLIVALVVVSTIPVAGFWMERLSNGQSRKVALEIAIVAMLWVAFPILASK